MSRMLEWCNTCRISFSFQYIKGTRLVFGTNAILEHLWVLKMLLHSNRKPRIECEISPSTKTLAVAR